MSNLEIVAEVMRRAGTGPMSLLGLRERMSAPVEQVYLDEDTEAAARAEHERLDGKLRSLPPELEWTYRLSELVSRSDIARVLGHPRIVAAVEELAEQADEHEAMTESTEEALLAYDRARALEHDYALVNLNEESL
jgi:hypothetical protein